MAMRAEGTAAGVGAEPAGGGGRGDGFGLGHAGHHLLVAQLDLGDALLVVGLDAQLAGEVVLLDDAVGEHLHDVVAVAVVLEGLEDGVHGHAGLLGQGGHEGGEGGAVGGRGRSVQVLVDQGLGRLLGDLPRGLEAGDGLVAVDLGLERVLVLDAVGFDQAERLGGDLHLLEHGLHGFVHRLLPHVRPTFLSSNMVNSCSFNPDWHCACRVVSLPAEQGSCVVKPRKNPIQQSSTF